MRLGGCVMCEVRWLCGVCGLGGVWRVRWCVEG